MSFHVAQVVNTYSHTSGTPIIIEHSDNGEVSDNPGSSSYIPFSCEYLEEITCLEFSFFYDLGNISVNVINLLTGGTVSQIVDTQFGHAYVSIPGTVGYYYLSVISSSGDHYYGQFIV